MWGIVLNYRERESFIKSFALFFITLLVLGSVALGLYHVEQKRFYQLQLLTEMDAFSYALRGEEFAYIIQSIDPKASIHELIVTEDEVYALFPWVQNPSSQMVKVSYPYKRYLGYMKSEIQKMGLLFGALVLVSALLSALFARYSLTPMRRSLLIMEDFLKDIIHDLGTPVTSILLNAQLLKRKYDDAEIDRITLGTQTIHALSKNLEALYRDMPLGEEMIWLGTFLEERVNYFQHLYPDLNWNIKGQGNPSIEISREILMRIVDNLLSNAGKYNRRGGEVRVEYDGCSFLILDTGVGIREPQKAFERFYRESDRGLGIGLHIVKTFADKAGISLSLESKLGVGTRVELKFC